MGVGERGWGGSLTVTLESQVDWASGSLVMGFEHGPWPLAFPARQHTCALEAVRGGQVPECGEGGGSEDDCWRGARLQCSVSP